jgi:hypothetical protein
VKNAAGGGIQGADLAISLTKSEIGLLKELKAAGDRGRLKSRLSHSDGLDRLVKANYVKAKSASKESMVYFITPFGSQALEHAG